MPNTRLTRSFLTDYANNELGFPTIEVELDPSDVTYALEDTCNVYNRYLPRRSRGKVTATPEQKRYLLSHTNLMGLVEVQIVPTQSLVPTGLDPFGAFQYNQILSAGDTYGEIYAQANYAKDYRKLMSSDADWHAQWEGAEFYLYLDIVRPSDVGYVYTWRVDPLPVGDVGDDYGLKHVDDQDMDWFLKYYRAKMTQRLARRLRKHGGVPTSEGGTDSLDGNELMTEAREDEEKLIQDIKSRSRPLPPEIG